MKRDGKKVFILMVFAMLLSSAATAVFFILFRRNRQMKDYIDNEERTMKKVSKINRQHMELLRTNPDLADELQDHYNELMLRFYAYSEDSLEALDDACNQYMSVFKKASVE